MLTARDSLCSDTSVNCNILTIDDPSAVQWDSCSFSTTPEAPVCISVCDASICIGCTWYNADLTLGVSADHHLINLPADTQLVGVISNSTQCLVVRWEDMDYNYLCYEVLMRKLSPKNLQDLCRNTITTATLGIPDRINQLLLPDAMKEFCKLKKTFKHWYL